jgi:hypothetical protein
MPDEEQRTACEFAQVVHVKADNGRLLFDVKSRLAFTAEDQTYLTRVQQHLMASLFSRICSATSASLT